MRRSLLPPISMTCCASISPVSQQRLDFMRYGFAIDRHGRRQGVLALQVHPEQWGRIEVTPQADGHIGRHATALTHDIVNRRRGHMQGTRQRGRGNAQWLQELFAKYFARMNGAHSVDDHGASSLVIIDDFNVDLPCICPLKTDAELIVNPDAVLPSPIPMQRLKPVTRRRPHVSKLDSGMQHGKLSGGDAEDIAPSPGAARFKKSLCFCASESQDHALILNVK